MQEEERWRICTGTAELHRGDAWGHFGTFHTSHLSGVSYSISKISLDRSEPAHNPPHLTPGFISGRGLGFGGRVHFSLVSEAQQRFTQGQTPLYPTQHPEQHPSGPTSSYQLRTMKMIFFLGALLFCGIFLPGTCYTENTRVGKPADGIFSEHTAWLELARCDGIYNCHHEQP